MNRSRSRTAALALALVVASVSAACGDDDGPVGLDREVVVGTYNLTALSFDPQGSIPEADLLARFPNPQLILTSNNSAQLAYLDPSTNLVVTVQGTYATTVNGVRIDLAANSGYQQLLFSRRMEFVFDASARTLTFDADAPDGVSRARLVALVPSLANEQLLDPTPGRLRIVFTRP
jgi:hypothetical protein